MERQVSEKGIAITVQHTICKCPERVGAETYARMILKTKLKLRHVNQDCSGTAQEMQAPAGECEGCPVVASVDHKVTEQGFWRNTREPGTITRASIPDNSKRLVKFPRSALRRMKCCGRKINTTIAVKAETVVRKNEKQRPGSNIVCGKLWSRIDAQGEETCGKERRQKRTRTSEEKGFVDRRKETRTSKEKVDIVDLEKKGLGEEERTLEMGLFVSCGFSAKAVAMINIIMRELQRKNDRL